jgi:hypothetical protein
MAKPSSILGFEQKTSSLVQPLRKESDLLDLEAKYTNNENGWQQEVQNVVVIHLA